MRTDEDEGMDHLLHGVVQPRHEGGRLSRVLHPTEDLLLVKVCVVLFSGFGQPLVLNPKT